MTSSATPHPTTSPATQLPGRPLEAPRASELPSDVVRLGSTANAPAAAAEPGTVLRALRRSLARPGPAAVVATSGSTGRPKATVLSTEALTASGLATQRACAGPGQWLLCLPVHYVAGLQVLARSVLAGTEPVVMPGDHFDPQGFADAAARLSHPTRYVSVVPTQLQRILDPAHGRPDPAALTALARFDAVLVGGSALSPRLAELARAAGVRVVTTYGMSETCGGCVYNATPLDTVRARVLPDDDAAGGPGAVGRVWLGGDVVASGYLDDPARTAEHFRVHDNTRWYRTDDLGRLHQDGTLELLGRTDDVINTGGIKVSAALVAARLGAHPRVRAALVVPVPDPQWGQAVAALVVPRAVAPRDLAPQALNARLRTELAEHVREALGAAAVPKRWCAVSALPLLATGKPDRKAAAALFG